MRKKSIIRKAATALLTLTMTAAMGISAFADQTITFHFQNAGEWDDVGAWIFQGIAWVENVTDAYVTVQKSDGEVKPLYPGAKCEDEGNGWFKVSATFSDSVAEDGMIMLFNNFVGDAETNMTQDQEDTDAIKASGILTTETAEQKQTPIISFGGYKTIFKNGQVPEDIYLSYDGENISSSVTAPEDYVIKEEETTGAEETTDNEETTADNEKETIDNEETTADNTENHGDNVIIPDQGKTVVVNTNAPEQPVVHRVGAPASADEYVKSFPDGNTSVSSEEIKTMIQENATKDVIIYSNNVIFTFEKGTMSEVAGVDSYDFGTTVISDFKDAKESGAYLSSDDFVAQINFNYSGKLPAKASIRILVGPAYAGKSLYYSQVTDKGLEYIMSATVDAGGFVTVSQDHCSNYVLTTEKPLSLSDDITTGKITTSNNQSLTVAPKTGDNTNTYVWLMMIVASAGAIAVVAFKKMKNA